jgi:PAS domain S-box-containing protein
MEQHNSSGGRNIIPGGDGHGHSGHDIFFAAVQMTRMPMILTDPHKPDNPIVFANQAFEKLTGYSQTEVMGRNCRFLQGPETDQTAVRRIRAAIDAREDVHEELLNYRKDGSVFWSAVFISPVFNTNQELVYFFASQMDVTRRREAEAVLQQAQRLETLGSMASGIAHEFNNLMTVVLGCLSRLERALPESGAEREKLDQARWAARQAGKLTQQMLSFARRQFHDNQRVDLNQLVTNIDDILRQVAGERVAFQLDLAPDQLVVNLDAGQMELALLNLVRNAADAMPDGGNLVIRTRATPGAAICTALLEVEDCGTGMPPDIARRAVDPFFTTKPKGAGTGLGLSMVNGFAAQSGGTLDIQSETGRGTKVILSFPVATY